MAAWRARATDDASSAEITMALTPWVVAVWMKGTCCVASAALGPTCVTVPPRSVAAFWAPLKATSKYGLLICLGMTTTLRAAADGAAAEGAADGAAAEGAADGAATDGAADGAVVADELQAATTRARTATPAASR